MIYTVTCNPALDWVMRLESFAEGATNRSVADALSVGGKGINVSTMLHRLGQPTCALGFVAGITGRAIETGLADNGIDTDFISLSDGVTRINVKLKHSNEAGAIVEETEINGCGPCVDAQAQNALIEQVSQLPAESILVLSGSAAPGCDSDFYARLMNAAPDGMRCVVDATGALLMQAVEAGPFLIKPNNEELAELANCDPHDADALVEAARMLAAKGARYVLVSCGGDGAFLVDADGLIARQAAPHGTLVNSVGAGDSMVAGFLAGLLDRDLKPDDAKTGESDEARALRAAVAAGSATAFSLGLAEGDDVRRLLDTLA